MVLLELRVFYDPAIYPYSRDEKITAATGPMNPREGAVPAISSIRPFNRSSAALEGLRRAAGMALAGALLVLAGTAAAQNPFPNKPIRVIVPYAPGGGTDNAARLIVPPLSERLGRPMVIESKPGASGAIGTEHVARSAPDGSTFLFTTSSVTIDPSTRPELPYAIQRDFAPVTNIGYGPFIVVVNNDLPVRSIKELVAYAGARPGQVDFGTPGTGSSGHIVGALFEQMTGIRLQAVPYKGSGQMIPALLSGEVKIAFDVIINMKGLAETNRVRALAVTSAQRYPSTPEIPTVAESFPGFEATIWLGMFAPAGTPDAILDKLNAETAAVLAEPGLRDRIRELGFEPVGNSRADFARQISTDIAKWEKVIGSAGIKLE